MKGEKECVLRAEFESATNGLVCGQSSADCPKLFIVGTEYQRHSNHLCYQITALCRWEYRTPIYILYVPTVRFIVHIM